MWCKTRRDSREYRLFEELQLSGRVTRIEQPFAKRARGTAPYVVERGVPLSELFSRDAENDPRGSRADQHANGIRSGRGLAYVKARTRAADHGRERGASCVVESVEDANASVVEPQHEVKSAARYHVLAPLPARARRRLARGPHAAHPR